MTPIRTLALLGLAGLLAPAAVAAVAATQETKVTLDGVHLCCGACVRAVDEAAAKVGGGKATCDRDAGTVLIVAPDAKAAQALLDAITDAGYHGTPDSDAVAVKDDSGVTAEKATSLTLDGVHNCCRGCAVAIEGALEDVDGIEKVTAEPKTSTVTVTGDFDPRAVVSALNDAGFHVKLKKD